MKAIIKKNWLYILGSLFLLMSLVYLFQYAEELNLFNDVTKIGIGFLLGFVLTLSGFIFHKRYARIYCEITAGIGSGILYGTAFIGGIQYKLWNGPLFFGIIICMALILLLTSSRLGFRTTAVISLLGFLCAPLLVGIASKHIFLLGLYLLGGSIVILFMNPRKTWIELRTLSLIGSWFVFYWQLLSHLQSLDKNTYLITALLLFVTYSIGLLLTLSKQQQLKTLDYILFLYNGFIFLRTLPDLGETWLIRSSLMVAVGILFILSGILIHYLFEHAKKHFFLNLAFGLFLILSSSTLIEINKAFLPMFITLVWSVGILCLLLTRKLFELPELKIPILILWFFTSIFWFFTTWNTPIGKWFDLFIPLLNWSGVTWIGLAILGFVIASQTALGLFEHPKQQFLPNMIKLSAHLVLVGLITFQTESLWQEYQIHGFDSYLIITLIWAIYAIVLLLRALYHNQKAYRNFALIILFIAAVKGLFVDLSASQTIYKIIFLFVLGMITFVIASLNKRWQDFHPSSRI